MSLVGAGIMTNAKSKRYEVMGHFIGTSYALMYMQRRRRSEYDELTCPPLGFDKTSPLLVIICWRSVYSNKFYSLFYCSRVKIELNDRVCNYVGFVRLYMTSICPSMNKLC